MSVLECQSCWNGYMVPPVNHHPAYLECSSCGAIELVYEPMDYQEELHEVPYTIQEDGSIKIHIIGAFGKLNLPN